jgi:alcohol dehydrogenase (cytochrome c)
MTSPKPTLLAGAFVLGLASLSLAAGVGFAQSARQVAPFTPAQAVQGKAAFERSCGSCHGVNLEGAGPAVALKGRAFLAKYGGGPVEALHADVRRMPPGNAASIDLATSVNIVAYLLQQNGGVASDRDLPSVAEAQAAMIVPGGSAPGQAALVNITPKPGPSALDRLRPVTEAELANPPANDWLTWRRTRDISGDSPLAQINRGNVKTLQTVWTWSLPKGANMMVPIVRDGVMFAYSSGDIVEALDAANGQLLWRHQRRLDPGFSYNSKKGVAIAGGEIIVPTSDAHVLALDFKTGGVVWDHKIDAGGQKNIQIKSAPLIVGDKAIIGMNGFAAVEGGNFILALDLKTGRELWRFYTIARPGEPGGDTWNDLPLNKRNGGSVWEGASYDPGTNLIYFGAAPSYSADGLRSNLNRPGVSNQGLYTNSTIALNADTGKLAWFFQHQPNDQIDLDWVFDRQLLDLTIDGKPRRVVVTAGKPAIYEALDAATGKYLFSLDLGLQNVITAIDPVTGAKTMNPDFQPKPGQPLVRLGLVGACPDSLGARNMMTNSYSPRTKLLYAPTTDTCVDPYPAGKRWQKTPDPATDGQFGIIQALDLNGRKVVWKRRQFAPPVSGNLSTAGGLLFTGDADRWFRALDERNGRELWKVRLDNEPESYPVTYSVNGKQYLAVATNEGWVHAQEMRAVAGITPPPNPGATLWVFALPN